MKTYQVELTIDEIYIIKDALNYMDVKNYYPKIARAQKRDDEITVKFYNELVDDNLNLFCKLHKLVKNDK